MARGLVLLCLLASACSSESAEPAEDGTRVLADYTRAGGFFRAPFPDASLLSADGRPELAGFPNPTSSVFVDKLVTLLERDARGFATTAGLFFALDGALDEAVEADYGASLLDGAPVFLVDVGDGSPTRGERVPVRVRFSVDGGPFGAENLLALIPLQGIPLRPGTRYAAAVTRQVLDASGRKLAVPRSLAQMRAGRVPDGMSPSAFDEHREALEALESLGLPASSLAGLSVFTTDEPVRDLEAVVKAMLAAPLPTVGGLVPKEVFADYCVFEGALELPVFQAGAPPFKEQGGEWKLLPDGSPELQTKEKARIVLTLPRTKMPAAGFPVVVMSRTGGGGDRPLVDRGVHPTPGAGAAPGSGPALEFARAGFAGVSVDGPHGGLRNVTGGDEQFLMFNVTNPAALRDNVRQSAAELALLAHVLEPLTLDASSCPGLDSSGAPAKLDLALLGLMGHSMGATIAPLTLAVEPRYRAAILSGAGGSMIENVLEKQKPVPVKGFAELLLGVAGKHSLSEADPALSLFQWAAEPADPPVYALRVVDERQNTPRHLLMFQGIVDHYIMPSIANAASLSLGLDLAGTALDETTAELAAAPHLGDLLQHSGHAKIGLPAQSNAGAATAVVVQHAEDGIEDGHEVMFQTEGPKHQYRCFLASLSSGSPVVPPAGGATSPCP